MENNFGSFFSTVGLDQHSYLKYITHCGSDEAIIEAARMSTDRGFEGWDKDEALLDFLYRHSHTTPFEMPDLTIEVQAPIMVFREWHRHRTQSYNELSARYTELPDIYYVPPAFRIKKQSTTNKQGSGDSFTPAEQEQIRQIIHNEQQSIRANYEILLKLGVAREIARINCPVSQYSRMRAKANLLNWLKFMTLRCEENAQWEIRQYANALALLISQLYPKTYKLFTEVTLLGSRFSKEELKLLNMCVDKVMLKVAAETTFGRGSRKADEIMEKIERYTKAVPDGT